MTPPSDREVEAFRFIIFFGAGALFIPFFCQIGVELLAEWLERRAKEKRSRERYTQLRRYQALMKENTDV